MTRSDVPGVEEYVTARGSDLLRTAWYLTGDGERARDLVARVLGRQLAHWDQVAAEGVGAMDTHLRRALVRAHLAHGDPGAASATDGLAGRLRSLPRLDRAAVVLRLVDGIPPDRVADLLDVSPAAVRTHTAAAVDALGLSEEALVMALAALVPVNPATEGLTALAGEYAVRRHRVRRVASWVGAGMVVAVAAAAAGSAALTADRDPVPRPVATATSSATTLAFQYCQQDYPSGYPPAELRNVSAAFDSVLVCARTDPDSVWSGSLPPDDALVSPAGLDSLRLEARGDVSGCPRLPRGPAFRLLVRAHDGTIVSYPNEALRCDGWLVLSDYYVAVAEQRLDPSTGRGPGGYLGCPPVPDGPDALARSQALPPDARFVTATVCLHPASQGAVTEQPRFRPVRMNVLGDAQLVPLNRDLAAGTHFGPAKACEATGWVYAVRGATADGVEVDLVNGCPDELVVPGRRTAIYTSPDTRSMLRALVIAN
jgi:DNA-directed RNA polymerase specialized sigma24 family protein